MRKKYPYKIILCVDEDFKNAVRRVQADNDASCMSEAIRRAIFSLAKSLPKVEAKP